MQFVMHPPALYLTKARILHPSLSVSGAGANSPMVPIVDYSCAATTVSSGSEILLAVSDCALRDPLRGTSTLRDSP